MLANTTGTSNQDEKNKSSNNQISVPSISLPKGGGAIRGMGEKFAANPVSGTGSMSVPIATSPGRSGFGPQLSLSYDSGVGNGPFGFGWSLSLPAITRKTDKGLPLYRDAEESDVYILSGAEDLVPVLVEANGQWQRNTDPPRTVDGVEYSIQRYRPRIEGLFARIERWTNKDSGEIHWRSISRDNITTIYGKTNNSRIYDPNDINPQHPTPTRIFSWLICESYDDKGNAIVYEYTEENDDTVDRAQANERNRVSKANRYLKSIKYGNRTPNRDATTWQATDPAQLPNDTWMFEVVFDYGQGYYSEDAPNAQGLVFARALIKPPAGSHWPVRQDPFSTYRAGFEVRTYRLCRRVLMFHHFPQELGINDYLVRSTEFSYTESPIASFISSVTQSGYVRQPLQNQPNRYLKKSLPPLEFEYSQVPSPQELGQQPIQEVDEESLENLPGGLDGASYEWMDIDGEATSGILTEQADGWYYKRNLSTNNLVREDGHERTVARFGPMEVVASKPAVGLAGGGQFLDLAGDGQVDLVQMEGSVRGFYERTDDADWAPFQPFVSWPNLSTRDPDLRFVDLTGDGHADILVTEGEALTWYPSLAEEGFGPAVRVSLPLDEEKGPRLVFADGEQSIYLADLSGDGLSDLVRIRNGEVCYWPNLGYGRFDAKVTMDHAPWFDAPDQFDQRRIRLADTDGSGRTDILYLRRDGVHIYFNQSGNSWSDAVELRQFPAVNDITSVQALDLLGNGTGCLVWSSALPGEARRPMRYIALMDEKPHLLIGVKNNLGAETTIEYAPSTKFYLDDKQNGRPWITRLPFPVHVVERVETHDYISRNRFVTLYKYHHGYFDGEEREFRGFGMVEQRDTEEFATLSQSDDLPVGDNIDASSHVPPVLTKTWFHTGAYIERGRISKQFEHEYSREGDVSRGETGLTNLQLEAMLLDDTVFPITIRLSGGTRQPYSLSGDETREACRSLKGAILRQEIYSLDKNPDGTPTDESDRPYSVSERNYTIELLQPRSSNQHAVFFTHAREQVDFHYERKLVDVNGEKRADPRVTHNLTLEVDAYGNILRTLTIGYSRRDLPVVTEAEQKETHMTLIVNRVANIANETDWYRIGVPVETRTYEIVKPPEPTTSDFLIPLLKFDAISVLINGLFPLEQAEPDEHKLWPYEKWDWRTNNANVPAETRLRLIEHVRSLYRRNTLNGFSPLGQVESLELPGESYKLAFTPNLLKTFFVESGKLDLQDVDTTFGTDGGYVHSEGDTNWWLLSDQIFYSPNTTDSAADELTFAREHFFLPHRYRDPFGNETFVMYDRNGTDPTRNHNLLLVETRDALGNTVTANTQDDAHNTSLRMDYRVLQPEWVTDPNKNRTRVAFDALGMVVATAVMGKPGQNLGDLLQKTDGSALPTDLKATETQAFTNDPHAAKADLLGRATTRIVYDLDRWNRETLPPFTATLARETHFHDTGGPQSKIQVSFSYSDGFGREIQKKIQAEPEKVNNVIGPPRWVGSGWTIFNNKGKPVRQYEPFFSTDHQFQFGKKVGVSPVLFYDRVERVVATLHPNHTYEKVVFDPWHQTTYDVNDTATFDPKTDPDVSDFFRRLPNDDYLPTWYERRKDGALGGDEQTAADRTAQHVSTPTTAYFDTLGRIFLTVANNGKDANGHDRLYNTRVVLDIEGNQREVIDARGRIVMRYDYDMLGNRIHQSSMDAGERWMLNDVTGKPIRAWDSRGHNFTTIYDALRRPLTQIVRGTTSASDQRIFNRDVVVDKIEYGEPPVNASQAEKDKALSLNLRTRALRHFDSAGIAISAQLDANGDLVEAYDFKGNLLHSTRQLVDNYIDLPDWSQNPPFESFESSTRYDALNRPTEITSPDQSVYHPTYNEANLLDKVDINLRGDLTPKPFVTNIDYNAKGQRTKIEYNEASHPIVTDYSYDADTFRLTRLVTRRPLHPEQDKRTLQDLTYTYDPVGTITHIFDQAQPRVFFDNDCVDASNDYQYDAIYRLIAASGREHRGQDLQPDWEDAPRLGNPIPYNCQEMRNYIETYRYDEVGNILQMIHHAGSHVDSPGIVIWNRRYQYRTDNNRLRCTSVPGETLLPDYSNSITPQYGQRYKYDDHGNMISMPHLTSMTWDYKDQLQTVNLGGGGSAYYVYDASGQRVRKVIHRHNGTKQKECIYLGGFEIYREYNGGNGVKELERETLHVMDDKQRIAQVETKTIDVDAPPNTLPEKLIRFQFSNHLGTACVEADDTARVISYEEYHPYGTTSYQAVDKNIKAAAKRYRYTGKERDEESGLYYHGARYYAAWLGRWTACDPKGLIAGPNMYEYVRSRPSNLFDPHGDIDDEAKEALRGLQKLADAIPQREFKKLNRAERGTRAHLALESLLHIDPSSPAKTPFGMRLAPEMLVDSSGVIVGFGEPGKLGKAMEGGRTLDVALLSESIHNLEDLVKNKVKAADVVLAAIDYKTGKAQLKNVGEMEALINAPYRKLVQKGNVLAAVEAKYAASPKKYGNKKLISTLIVVAVGAVATSALAAEPKGQSAPAPAPVVTPERTPEQERLLNMPMGSDLAGHTMSQEAKQVQDIGEQSIPWIDRFFRWLRSPWIESSDQLAGKTGTGTQNTAQKELKPGQAELLESMKKARQNQPQTSPY